MAAPHVFVSYTVEDAKGEKSSFNINFPDSVDIAILKLFARSTAEMIDDLIKGRITAIGVGLQVDMAGLTVKTTANADADVEEGARFSWRTALNTLTSFRLPTFDETFLNAGTRQVNTANVAVNTLVQRILAGQTQGVINVSPSDDRGEDVTALESATESFTRSRG